VSDPVAQESVDVSVVISTYNRSAQLRCTLGALLGQCVDGIRWEVIIVDNNSTDDTPDVVQSYIGRGTTEVTYVFEARQGLAFGRNAGIARARAPLVAFTDDDVRPAPDWLPRIKRCFDEHPAIDFIGGRVLPCWPEEPPAWLTPDHWSPLALVDYGNEMFVVNQQKPFCLVGANMAFRREVFDRIGLFSPELQRVKDAIGSAEDHDLQMRVWDAGRNGLYAPDIVVMSDVQPDRITKQYHRQWYAGHGRFSSRMRLKERMSDNGALGPERTEAPRLFDVPSFVYHDVCHNVGQWWRATARGNESSAFFHENRVRHSVYYIRERYGQHASGRKHSVAAEISQFVRKVVRKRLDRLRKKYGRVTHA
jgi:glycosyltransferase involved in cell wall biosynthesis